MRRLVQPLQALGRRVVLDAVTDLVSRQPAPMPNTKRPSLMMSTCAPLGYDGWVTVGVAADERAYVNAGNPSCER